MTRIFDSVRKFYIPVVNKMIKIFPSFCTNPDPALRESYSLPTVLEWAIRFGLMEDEH